MFIHSAPNDKSRADGHFYAVVVPARHRIDIGGIFRRRILGACCACRTAPLGGIRGQSLGRAAVGNGISSRREDVRELIRREAQRAEVDVRSLHRRGRISQ